MSDPATYQRQLTDGGLVYSYLKNGLPFDPFYECIDLQKEVERLRLALQAIVGRDPNRPGPKVENERLTRQLAELEERIRGASKPPTSAPDRTERIPGGSGGGGPV